MKKILLGVLGVLVAGSLTFATARALFISTATVNNVAFTSGNASLKFSYSASGPWMSSYTFQNYIFQNVYPGFSANGQFFVKNESASAIKLHLTARLVSATGDWGALSGPTSLWVGDNAGSVGSGYITLANWNATPQDINITLDQNEVKTMRAYFVVDSSAGNEIANKALSTNWEMYGTQVTP